MKRVCAACGEPIASHSVLPYCYPLCVEAGKKKSA